MGKKRMTISKTTSLEPDDFKDCRALLKSMGFVEINNYFDFKYCFNLGYFEVELFRPEVSNSFVDKFVIPKCDWYIDRNKKTVKGGKGFSELKKALGKFEELKTGNFEIIGV